MKKEEMTVKKSELLYLHYFFADDYQRMSEWIIQKTMTELSDEEIEKMLLSPSQQVRFQKFRQLYTPQSILLQLNQKQITPITLFSDYYPPLLKEIYDPPYVLYCKGNIELLKHSKWISMVGSRTPTPYGEKAVDTFVSQLKSYQYGVISGLAKGIDSLVHKSCLQQDVPTIGILGSGFDYIYPKENKRLVNQMLQKNLIITEYPPIYPPQKWYFPKRNRIISGISKGTVVIEAKKKSGSLITADQALEQGRDVFACPGSIFSDESEGTNTLILQGAKLVLGASDIMIEMEGNS